LKTHANDCDRINARFTSSQNYSCSIFKSRAVSSIYFHGARRQLVYNDISADFLSHRSYTLTNARNGPLETRAEECVVSRGESLMRTCQRAFDGRSRGASRHLLTISDHLGTRVRIHQEVGFTCRIVRYQSLAMLINVYRHQ